MMRHSFTLLLCCLVLLAACTQRGPLQFVASVDPDGKIERIFVATTRQKGDLPYDFNELRTSEVSYARYDVSIPPTHKVGKIEWPKSKPNPATDFVVVNAETFTTPASFGAKVKTENNKRQNKNSAIVFIHGYNNTFSESLYRFAQIASDTNQENTPILYAWPSTEKPYEYLHDRDSVLFARDGLESLLKQLVRSGTTNVTLVAHSIGSMLLMETLRQLAISGNKTVANSINTVVLISPDLDNSLFKTQLNQLNPLPSPFIIFSDDNDHALKITSFLTGKGNRVGQATSADGLDKYGIQVINLSKFTDGDGYLNHTVALTSPTVIAILNSLPSSDEISKENTGYLRNLLNRLFKQ